MYDKADLSRQRERGLGRIDRKGTFDCSFGCCMKHLRPTYTDRPHSPARQYGETHTHSPCDTSPLGCSWVAFVAVDAGFESGDESVLAFAPSSLVTGTTASAGSPALYDSFFTLFYFQFFCFYASLCSFLYFSFCWFDAWFLDRFRLACLCRCGLRDMFECQCFGRVFVDEDRSG